jgi:hypothetical protein
VRFKKGSRGKNFSVPGPSLEIAGFQLRPPLREEVRPIKSEIRNYKLAKYDFRKYVCSQYKTH